MHLDSVYQEDWDSYELSDEGYDQLNSLEYAGFGYVSGHARVRASLVRVYAYDDGGIMLDDWDYNSDDVQIVGEFEPDYYDIEMDYEFQVRCPACGSTVDTYSCKFSYNGDESVVEVDFSSSSGDSLSDFFAELTQKAA